MAYFLSLLRSEALELGRLTGRYLLSGLIFFLWGSVYSTFVLALNLNNVLSFSFCLVAALVTAQLSWNYLAERQPVRTGSTATTLQNVEIVGTPRIMAVTGASNTWFGTVRSNDIRYAMHFQGETVKHEASTSADIFLIAA